MKRRRLVFYALTAALFAPIRVYSFLIDSSSSPRIERKHQWSMGKHDLNSDESSRIEFNLLESSSDWYPEEKPKRLGLMEQINSHGSNTVDFKEEWGLEHYNEAVFPGTLDELVDEVFYAIAGTIYHVQVLDPNIASNAMSKSIFTKRPVRSSEDSGRIGIELDGVETLFQTSSHRVSSQRAIRCLAFQLAAKLSSSESWSPFEPHANSKNRKDNTHRAHQRPIVLCFNTVKQALAASHELQLVKQRYLYGNGGMKTTTPFDSIKIQCIHDGIPKDMQIEPSKRKYRHVNSAVNAANGLIIAVQPSDYNGEFKPPGPAVDAVGNFQKLAARATVEQVPFIALSPRFLSNNNMYGGWDQSGYQKSATYGGVEPPKGPTPWIMRDFSPPSYCWIANALPLQRLGPRCTDNGGEKCFLSRVALKQTVMDNGHAWSIFAAKECHHGARKVPTEFLYVASTRNAAGRPTRQALKTILESHIIP